ncbi:1313_t:CDS:2 [Ambispora gerdemannii]|uniref:1313_t:CDS:1 n=1 Tax=Ambispora gerdemannii TaxID=144530 RepID=A0A9N9G5T2_9GLOM|nr:1313_t:CDS:2 [Ambispora gerdemannii]
MQLFFALDYKLKYIDTTSTPELSWLRSLSRQLQLRKALVNCPKIFVSQQQQPPWKINAFRTWTRTNKGLKPQTCKYRAYSTKKASQNISQENSATKTENNKDIFSESEQPKVDEVDSSAETTSQIISRENPTGKIENTRDKISEPEQLKLNDNSADTATQNSESLVDKNQLTTKNVTIVESTIPLRNSEQVSSEQEHLREEPNDDDSFRNKFKEFSKIKISSLPKLPILLILSAIGLTSIGIYQFYSSNIQKYPETIRNHLKKGLYYQNYAKNPSLAVDYYQKALTEALHSPELENSSPEVTGIMIQLGSLYEDLGRFRDAIDVLSMAYDVIVTPNDSPPLKLDGQNRTKAIGIAQKIGDLCQTIKQDDLAEKYYVWSVGQLGGGFWTGFFGKKLDVDTMPSWITAVDLGASLETLDSYALPLYIRALQLVNSNEMPCHTAVLMNNISEVFTGMGDLEVAQGWAERGLRITQEKSHLQKKNSKECDESCGVLLFNLGMIAELSGNLSRATEYYEKSRIHAKSIKFHDCVKEADAALQRITAVMNDVKEDSG